MKKLIFTIVSVLVLTTTAFAATSYTNFLKLRAQGYNNVNWDVELNESLVIVDFATAAQKTRNRVLIGGEVTDGGVLDVDYATVVAILDGVRYEIAGSSVTLSASSLNFVYINSAGAVTASTSAPSGNYVPLAVVDTGGATITRIGDCRPFSPAATPGKNIFINGDFYIDQANSGAAVSVSNADKYSVDMFEASAANHIAVVNVQQITGFGGFEKAISLTVTTAATLSTDKNTHGFRGKIEYKDCQLLKDRYFAIRFKFKSNVTGIYSAALLSGDKSNSYVTTFSYASAATVQDVTLTIPVPSAKVVAGTNGEGLALYIGVAADGVKATSTLNAWQAGEFLSAATATDWETTISNYISIAGLYGGVDSLAAEFPHRPYSTELALCQRYLLVSQGILRTGLSQISATYAQSSAVFYPVQMRTTPTITLSGVVFSGYTGTPGALSNYYATTRYMAPLWAWTSGTSGYAANVQYQFTADARM